MKTSVKRLLTVDRAGGSIHHGAIEDLPTVLRSGDLLVLNDAATLPASFTGTHATTGAAVELRLVEALEAPSRWRAVTFGAGDWRQRTEDRPPAPALRAGERIELSGGLVALVAEVSPESPRWIEIQFQNGPDLWSRLYRAGRLIQYSYASRPLELWDHQTIFAGPPVALEPPSAAFALDWAAVDRLERRGVSVAALTHAAGISSTGDPTLDRKLPLPERYWIPERTEILLGEARASGGRIVALGTSVVRALESHARTGQRQGVTSLRLGPLSQLRAVDGLLTRVHEAGSSHRELLSAFVSEQALARAYVEAEARGYRAHENGDSFLVI